MLTLVILFKCHGPWEACELASSGILLTLLVLLASDTGKTCILNYQQNMPSGICLVGRFSTVLPAFRPGAAAQEVKSTLLSKKFPHTAAYGCPDYLRRRKIAL
jgi:hypothetical protein